jgi:hypothetical protein
MIINIEINYLTATVLDVCIRFLFSFLGGVRLSPLGTLATIWILYQSRMRVEQLAGETEVLGDNFPQCHFVHHKSHMTWPGLELRLRRWRNQLTAWAMALPLCIKASLQVLTAPFTQGFVLWDITTCNQLKVNPRFGRKCRLYIKFRRTSPTRNNLLATCFKLLLSCLTLLPWRWRQHVPPKRQLISHKLHGVIPQMT